MTLDIIKDGIKKYGTPSYFFDLDSLKDRVMAISRKLFPKAGICYAMKANPFIIRPMDSYIDKYEVCSPGEYEICNRHGIAPEKIVVSGVNKNDASMERILELSGGKGTFTIESMSHYLILSRLCHEKKLKINVLIRLSSGNQFGVDKAEFERIALLIKDDEFLNLAGIHYYSGTQKKMKKIAKEIEMLKEFKDEIFNKHGIVISELEYGPGLIYNYFENEAECGFDEQLDELRSLLDEFADFEGITLEMGRFIASECGYYATEVIDVKCNDEHNYCIVDGGIHQLNYYGQTMGMKKPYMEVISDSEEMTKWNVCGSLCTVNDVILRDVELPVLSPSDVLVFKRCGAYSVTEGMALFLSRELPAVIFYDSRKGCMVARNRMGTDTINEEN